MLIVRLIHIADMPSIPELLKQNNIPEQKPEIKPEPEKKQQFLEIKTTDALMRALQDTRELLLYSYYTSNLEILEFEVGKIKYFDRKGDKDFSQKLTLWLKDKTNQNWTIERIENDPHNKTISEQIKSEIEADPMVSSAMDLFEDAELVNISK